MAVVKTIVGRGRRMTFSRFQDLHSRAGQHFGFAFGYSPPDRLTGRVLLLAFYLFIFCLFFLHFMMSMMLPGRTMAPSTNALVSTAGFWAGHDGYLYMMIWSLSLDIGLC
jgi:hypothetical protein